MNNEYLEQIYRQYYTPLLLYALSLTSDQSDAEDLVANTFVKAMLSYDHGNLKAWLYTVLKNEYFNIYKKSKRFHPKGEDAIQTAAAPTDILRQLIHKEEKRWLYAQIYRLNPLEREIMLLSTQSDLDDRTIASIVGININRLRVTRHRVRQKLIDLCRKEDFL